MPVIENGSNHEFGDGRRLSIAVAEGASLAPDQTEQRVIQTGGGVSGGP